MEKNTIAQSLMALAFAGILFSSCNNDPLKPGYEYMPNMYRSPSYETYSPNPNFKDSMTARLPVKGTIPRGFSIYPYPNTPEGYEAAGRDLTNPFEAKEENVAEGKRLFDIYCIHCHGSEGKGDGQMVQNGKFAPPPSYSGPLKDLPAGKMFHTLQFGKNMMGSHTSQLSRDERWKVILYVQKLQKLNSTASADTTTITKK